MLISVKNGATTIMQLEVVDTERLAACAARFEARQARATVEQRGRFILAVSGGSTPWQMLRALAGEEVPWSAVHVVQVDERVAPAGDDARNLTHLRQSLLAHAPLPPEHIHAMPVEMADLQEAAAHYAATLEALCGVPPVLDLAHLGLGADGHTASLVPGDPVLQVHDRDVAVTGAYQGHRRMTLTFPMLDRARAVLWLVAGSSKTGMLARLLRADPTIPAGCVAPQRATVFADRAAAAGIDEASTHERWQ